MDSTKLLSLLQEKISLDEIELDTSKGGSITIGSKRANVKVDVDFSKTTKASSIKNQARKSIAQFPVLVSENLNPSLTPIMLNAIEAKNALYLAMLIQNTRSFNSTDVTGVIGTFIKESANISENVFLEGCDSVRELCKANADLLVPYEDAFNKKSLNETYYSKSLMYFLEKAEEDEQRKKEDRKRKQQKEDEKHSWEREDRKRKQQREDEKDKIDAEERERKHRREDEKDKNDAEDRARRQRREDEKDQADAQDRARRQRREDEKDANDRAERERDAVERRTKNGVANVLTQPKDLVKQNDLQPLILKTEINFTDPQTNAVIKREIMIGVKSVGHLVKSKDIVYYLVKSAYKNNFFLKLIKWTTGEISFFKDLLFTLDDIKNDVRVAAGSNNRNPFYQLAQKAKQAKGKGLRGDNDLPTQITTLVLTKTDVENIKYKDGINILSNPEYLRKILVAYHLMDIYIVDESLDIVYAYNEQNHCIDRMAFSSFEKQSKERKVNANDLYKLFK